MADESTAITTEIPVIAPSIGVGRSVAGRPVASNPAARAGKLVTAAENLRRGNSSTVKIVPTTAPAAQAVELQKPQETHQLQELQQVLRTRQAQQSQAVVCSEAANSSNQKSRLRPVCTAGIAMLLGLSSIGSTPAAWADEQTGDSSSSYGSADHSSLTLHLFAALFDEG